jgi:hypothetical protein
MSSKQQAHSSAAAIASWNSSRTNGSLTNRSVRRRAPLASTSVSRAKSADTTRDGSMVEKPEARRHSLRQVFRNVLRGPTWGRAIAWNTNFVLQRHGKELASQTAQPQVTSCRTVNSCCLKYGVSCFNNARCVCRQHIFVSVAWTFVICDLKYSN